MKVLSYVLTYFVLLPLALPMSGIFLLLWLLIGEMLEKIGVPIRASKNLNVLFSMMGSFIVGVLAVVLGHIVFVVMKIHGKEFLTIFIFIYYLVFNYKRVGKQILLGHDYTELPVTLGELAGIAWAGIYFLHH